MKTKEFLENKKFDLQYILINASAYLKQKTKNKFQKQIEILNSLIEKTKE